MPQPPKLADPHGETLTCDPSSASDPRAGFVLVVSSESGVSVESVGVAREVSLGRGAECDVVVVDSSVSRKHAVLRFGDEITVEDLASTNGTTVQGRRSAPHERVAVAVGSVFEIGTVTVLVQRARELVQLAAVTSRARGAQSDAPLHADPTMLRLYALLDAIAPTRLSILVLGETGVGKEVFAAAVHARSARAAEPFVMLNCAAIASTVMESELFGHERGAFTGADHAKPGLFETAHRGTLFLDEIGEMPLATQAKLLRVLESGEILRLGSVAPKTVDVRIVSATNRDLRKHIASGGFRSDLYFRLNGMTLTLPPLRARRADILPLAHLFVERAAAKLGRSAPALSALTAHTLERYEWPGNVRELRNVIDRAVALSAGAPVLEPEHLLLGDDPTIASVETQAPAPSSEAARSESSPLLRDQIESFEKQRVLDALAQTDGNQSRAAELLGVSRRTLVNKLGAFGIARPRKRTR